jgi:hypothetical protein
MKLDILTKQRIDKWFSEVTADELLYITKKYLTQDQSLQLIQPVFLGQSKQLKWGKLNKKFEDVINNLTEEEFERWHKRKL